MTTFATLQTDIADYLHRTDLTDKIPGFIALAESAIFRELNIRDIQATDEGTTYDDIVDLPSDFHALVRLTTTVGGVETSMDYASEGQGYNYAEGGIRVADAGTGTEYKMYYTPVIRPLSSTYTTNWLLTNAADLYLYASCVEAAKYIRDTEQVGLLSSVVAGLLDSVRRLTVRRFIPGGSLQIKPR